MAGPEKTGKCFEGMVYVPEGIYKSKNMPALCVDEHEFSNGDALRLVQENFRGTQNELWKKYTGISPCLGSGVAGYIFKPVLNLPVSQSQKGFEGSQQPMVQMTGHEAKQLCEAQGKRLATPDEWARVASQNGTKEYSTRSGNLDGAVHYKDHSTRDVCEAKGNYVEYNGREVCDMSGNVYEWTQDPSSGDFYAGGGAWGSFNTDYLRASDRIEYDPDSRNNGLGFRCVASPESAKE